MTNSETLNSFYKHKLNDPNAVPVYSFGDFNVFNISDRIISGETSPTFIRRDFYKIMLYQGNNVFHYGDKSISITGNTLLFFNPMVPYTYNVLHSGTRGYFCVFKSAFLQDDHKNALQENSLFTAGAKPVLQLNELQTNSIKIIFQKMEEALRSEFTFKYDLIRTYISELIYFGMNLNSVKEIQMKDDASSRLMSVFSELLERQFPIESIQQRFTLRSPQAIADRLSVHINYLNRAVKKASGKTTSQVIFERMEKEAIALLKYTDWPVADIAYVLGFETAAHFNNFFRKHTNTNPLSFRIDN